MKNEILFSVIQILLTLCQYKESRAIDDYGIKRYSDTYYDKPPYAPSLSELALLNGLEGADSNYIVPEHHDVDASSLHHLMEDDGDDDHYYDYYANGFGYEHDPDIELWKYKMDHLSDHHDFPDHYHHYSEPFFPVIPPTPTFRTKNRNNKNKKKKKKNDFGWTSKFNGFNKKKKPDIKPVTENRPNDFMYDFRTKLHSI